MYPHRYPQPRFGTTVTSNFQISNILPFIFECKNIAKELKKNSVSKNYPVYELCCGLYNIQPANKFLKQRITDKHPTQIHKIRIEYISKVSVFISE